MTLKGRPIQLNKVDCDLGVNPRDRQNDVSIFFRLGYQTMPNGTFLEVVMETVLPPAATHSTKKFEVPRKRFHGLLKSPASVIQLDPQGNIRHLSADVKRLLEYGSGERLDPCFFTHVHSKNLYQVMRDVADMVCYGKKHARWLMRLRTGRKRWLWFKANVRNVMNGTEPGISIELREVGALS